MHCYIMLALKYALDVFKNMDNFLKIGLRYEIGIWHKYYSWNIVDI